MAKRRKRIPKLRFTSWRKLGWHVAYRDRESGIPQKHLFNIRDRAREGEARVLYHAWVAEHLGGMKPGSRYGEPSRAVRATRSGDAMAGGGAGGKAGADASPLLPDVKVSPGSLLHVGSGLLRYEEGRARKPGEPRRPGTIALPVYRDRRKHVFDFLNFLNERYGESAVGRMKLIDLTMADVEAYNASLVKAGYSSTQVSKRLQIVKRIVDRAGRPEHGEQVLGWNWDSRDVVHGVPTKRKTLPTLAQLKKLLAASDARGRAMIWLGLGVGFGQSDLAVVRVGQIDAKSYDLRRQKTGIERYGETPPMTWNAIGDYLKEHPRSDGELLFVTRKGLPLVHSKGDAVQQWWHKLRIAVGESSETLGGFYLLRHVGATEFGSRDGCSVSAMKRWLGHSASSDMADVYMRPIAPEHRSLVNWVRKTLGSGDDGWQKQAS